MFERQDPHVPARTAQLPPTMVRATRNWDDVCLKWRELAERRKAHFIDLFETGRWKHYYTDVAFLAELRQAVAAADRWNVVVAASESRSTEAADAAPEREDALQPAA